MPLLDQFPRVSIDLIEVPTERQRESGRESGVVSTSHIQPSIARLGVLMPLLVEVLGHDSASPRWRLVSGECRLQSCRNLVEAGQRVAANGQDLTTVPVRLANDLTPLESKLFELTENVKRKDLGWQDLVRSLAGIHRLCRELDSEWTLGETGEVASLSTGIVSMYLRVESELEDLRISDCTTVREAYNVLTRRDQRALGDALDELASVPRVTPAAAAADAPASATVVQLSEGRVLVQASPVVASPDEDILNVSFLDWAPRYSGQPFSLIHCDFPYGIEAFQGEWALQGGDDRYDDSREVYFTLLDCLCKNLDRLMSLSGHLMFWYSGKLDPRQRFAELVPELEFHPFPLIWHKSDSKGIVSDFRRGPRHVYETCWLGIRGRRNVLEVKNDLYAAPSAAGLHVHVKPEPMLRYFMSMLVDGTTRMLDPTCGSGSALRAAESLGARVVGLEVDSEACEVARKALRNFRLLREGGRE